MGLDMYLKADIFAGQYLGSDVFEKIEAAQLGWPTKPEMFEISATVVYWRKANHIHGWFVKNVQEGTDDCGTYYVSEDKLQQLHDLCDELLKDRDTDKAAELLPPESGFFFGNTEVDEWYWSKTEHTRDELAKILAAIADKTTPRFSYHYHSSW